MPITRINFQNFRNFQSLDLETSQGFVVITGDNGSGKTNLLEGIYWGVSLRKFPGTKLPQLLKTGENFYRVKIDYNTDQNLEIFCQAVDEKLTYKLKTNNQAAPRIKYTGNLSAISFIPEDMNLLSHSPTGRRRFLDETLSASSAEYRHTLSQYNKTLKQRNELLENINKNAAKTEELDIWDEQLAEFGCAIVKHRTGLLRLFSERFSNILKNLSPDLRDSAINYLQSGAGDKQEFLQSIKNVRARELALGRTVIGPHKDDFRLILKGQDVVGYLSRGQLRSLTLGLKIMERQYLEEKLGYPPIMLLDDVFSEFDQKHQRSLIEFLKTFPQVFLSTAHLEEIKIHLPANSQILTVENGHVQ